MVSQVLQGFHEDSITTVIVDTPAKNHAAKSFLIKMGFCEPREHVYLSLNIERQAEKVAEQKEKDAKTTSKTVRAARKSGSQTRSQSPENGKEMERSGPVKIREMEIDDLQRVFELGESVYDAARFPSLNRIWSEHEVAEWFVGDRENCLIAEVDKVSQYAITKIAPPDYIY